MPRPFSMLASRRWFTLLACAAVAVLGACDAWLTRPSLYNTVRVAVRQRNGAPIPGVDLTLYTGQRPMGYGKTGNDGTFTFARVPQGLYGVYTTVPEGYVTLESLIGGPSTLFHDDLRVADDTLSTVNFTFLKRGPGSIVVRVVDRDGAPIPHVPATVYDPHQEHGKSETGPDGLMTFPALPFGVYGVLVTRPLFYRDYRAPNDSLYAVRDNLVVDDQSSDTVTFRLQPCAGTLNVTVQDGSGLPVPGTTVVFYTSTQELAKSITNAAGVTAARAPCATQLGALITPAAGYSVAEGRGSRFIDGITLTDGQTVNLPFRVQKTR